MRGGAEMQFNFRWKSGNSFAYVVCVCMCLGLFYSCKARKTIRELLAKRAQRLHSLRKRAEFSQGDRLRG